MEVASKEDDETNEELQTLPARDTAYWKFWFLTLACALTIAATKVVLNGIYSKDQSSVIEMDDSRIQTLSDMMAGSLMALSDPASPQSQALNWLAHDDPAKLDLESAPSSVILERYALAVLYFATDGKNWKDDFRFLSARSVCEWHDDDEWEGGVTCDESKSFVEELNMCTSIVQIVNVSKSFP